MSSPTENTADSTSLLEENLLLPDSPVKKRSNVAEIWIWARNWTEDGIGVALAFILFTITSITAQYGVDISNSYAKDSQWPFGAVFIGLGVTIIAHRVLGKPCNIEAYCVVMVIAVVARAIGYYKDLANSGLSASLWAILIGILCRYLGLNLKDKGIFSGEFFVKIGVTLLAMDFTSIVTIGLPGLGVAWADTLIVLTIGIFIAVKISGFDLKDAIVIAGATSICGSSAATALSSSIHEKNYKDETARTIIAIMGVFNSPLMPLMPLLKTIGHINPVVIGGWIGGSIDSTGQVTASAQMGGDKVLKSAIIVKMAQNILIGPLCLLFTAYFQGSFQPNILISKFPLFVIGFLITSTITTIILNTSTTEYISYDLKDLIINNTWCVSEWLTLIGFAVIGLEIDIKSFFSKRNIAQQRILSVYLIIQCIDICTTFGWSYLMFYNKHINDDDSDE